MRKIISQLLYLLLFWMLVFFLGRLSFYLCVTPLLSDVSITILFQSFYKGLRLDLSTAGYFLSVPSVLLIFFLIFKKKLFLYFIDFINYLLIIVYTLTVVGEACLYREWKSKLSMQALQHFMHPSEVFKTTSWGLTVLFFGLSLLLIAMFVVFYNKKIKFSKQSFELKNTILKQLSYTLIFVVSIFAVLIIFIRGGLQAIPIQNSDAYFCNKPIVNDVAVNPFWNIMYSISDYFQLSQENPFKDFEQTQADRMVRDLYSVEKDSTEVFLTTNRPNIVFIIMESWSAYVIKSFGGDNFAPFIDSLSNEGVLFSKLYPPAYVSDQGIPSILSGYPSVSRISIVNQISKSTKIPCINQDLKKYGYQSAFVFGGDLNYGNIKSYIFNKEFDIVKEEKDFDGSIERGKLGIQDEYMAKEYLSFLNKAQQPFLYAWFTLSSHMPYDYVGEKSKLVNHKENDYINSISYCDAVFKNVMNAAKKEQWYKNTLFVIVADHSHATHKDFSVYDSEYHRIPLLFFGDVIKPEYKGKKIDKVLSQMDIPATLLNQLGLSNEAKQYVWSKNMFNPYTKSFAYYCSFAGGGMVTTDGSVGYQHGLDGLVIDSTNENKKLSDSLWRLGKAFQQSVYEDYRLK
ncbi:MAG: sulfatase-like hydrolase/transferase [Bacteroidia bacterium]|nr:sulfatase-like hydrolase/transferase [Bacteroidia bacterium]